MTNKKARITLVGAGPGDKDLITVKGLKAIQSADVVLYDALVSPELLEEIPSSAIKLFVGKRAGVKCKKQEEINLLLVQAAFEYGHAVRLKGGDPFVFGRGYEEKEYAESFGLSVTVIPGISSSISVPLLQGVPVTSRGMSESFWVLTGSTKSHQLSKDIELAMQSSATIVILMGIRKLPFIVDMLHGAGKDETPIMVIQSGSTQEEKCVVGDSNSILQQVKEKQIATPGIIVIGEVVKTHKSFVKRKALTEWNK
jgi:uroporphyrin-III C-methyltransferase